jgi:hypothetical protein
MGYPRKYLVDPHVSGVYHCISRCVRQQSLIGSVERCAWVVRRLEALSRTFAIDICDFAVMRNHVHLLLRTQPDLAMAWSDEEVARRWLLRPGAVSRSELDDRVMSAVDEPERVAEWRSRLCDLGWFHKLWKEPCSRRWNREDGQSGHLWQGRFRSIGCRDEDAVLMQAGYILLNPVHCGAEAELCDSPRTSMGRRIVALVDAIAAGRCRQGVEAYRRALLEPALPCDPGCEVIGLDDEEWSIRVAEGVHERSLREAAAEQPRSRPAARGTSGRSFREPDEVSVSPFRWASLEPPHPKRARVPVCDGAGSLLGEKSRIASRSFPSDPVKGITPRSATRWPCSGFPNRVNPWRDRPAMAMVTSLTLTDFVDWVDRRGRIQRPDKAGFIDPSRPRILLRLSSDVGMGQRLQHMDCSGPPHVAAGAVAAGVQSGPSFGHGRAGPHFAAFAQP